MSLSNAIRRTFCANNFTSRCQVHQPQNILKRLPAELRMGVRWTVRSAWDWDTPVKAQRLIRNLTPRLENDDPDVS